MSGEGPVLVLRRATYRYPGGVVAVDGVSLDVAAGDVIGIAGANGAGKSTLARLCNGLLRPVTGSIVVDGLDTRRHEVHELARTVGLVFQHPRAQLFARTVAEELAFGPRNLGCSKVEVQGRVARAAARLGLQDVMAVSPFELPAPRRRHVAIASVLTMEPRVLVLDEPTTGQDQDAAAVVADIVRDLRAEGVAVACISHDMRLLAAIADRVVVMAAGRVVAAGTPRSVFADAAMLEAAGLLAPQVTRLGLALPRLRGRPVVLAVEELAEELAAARGSGGEMQ
ncbi:MAG TPA: ABC transporter ATP-binding protein [Candidatus Limnocylindrales bacterium]